MQDPAQSAARPTFDESGEAGSEPAQDRSDHGLVLQTVTHHETAERSHPVPHASHGGAGLRIFATARLLVKEVRTGQADFDLWMFTQVNHVL
jgi:hypothetical protein